MKILLIALGAAGTAAIAVSGWLPAAGLDLVVERPSGAAFVLSAWIGGVGVGLLIVALVMAAVVLPLGLTLRRVSRALGSDVGLLVVAQKTPELQELVSHQTNEVLPTYVVIHVGRQSTQVWARGTPIATFANRDLFDLRVTDSFTSRPVPAIQVNVRGKHSGSLKFVPSRKGVELMPILNRDKVNALAKLMWPGLSSS
ncbi:hypothetical protein [Antiquaquibacter soli]|uniref:DUF502 domain-containing protein n=1 Tax=Antiquaquibacter soli TaxID=3064523 RepID=A0ABT9BTK7_9MICO|nr:hypothetical protein [Protaetiibacter sp. WY-16]MDO7883717.1 hypothetical protein [Protaetiibacter sp. WY-16]